MIRVAECVKIVKSQHGAQTAERFRRQFADRTEAEITHTEALKALDRAILNGKKPVIASFGRTTSQSCALKVPNAIKKIAKLP